MKNGACFFIPHNGVLLKKHIPGPARVLAEQERVKCCRYAQSKMVSQPNDGKERILFTTFTANLAGDIKDNLRKICSVEEQRHIEVVNLNAWVSQYLREQGYPFTIVYEDSLSAVWDEAIALTGQSNSFTAEFYAEEWSKVVASQEAFSQEAYMRASRVGRGHASTERCVCRYGKY